MRVPRQGECDNGIRIRCPIWHDGVVLLRGEPIGRVDIAAGDEFRFGVAETWHKRGLTPMGWQAGNWRMLVRQHILSALPRQGDLFQ